MFVKKKKVLVLEVFQYKNNMWVKSLYRKNIENIEKKNIILMKISNDNVLLIFNEQHGQINVFYITLLTCLI